MTYLLAIVLGVAAIPAAHSEVTGMPPLQPLVEVEEPVYQYVPAENGADPMWCHGCSCIARIGADVFASGLETLADARPLNNVRWLFFRRGAGGWELQQADISGRTREPCPLVCFRGGPLLLSANPTLLTDPQAEGGGPARPEILRFDPADPKAPYDTLLPQWDGEPAFTEHSYRTFAADGPSGDFVLMQNIGASHSEWAFCDKAGEWTTGKLHWPPREDTSISPYGETLARCNYPDVVLKNRALHFCGAPAYNKWSRVSTMDKAGRQFGNRWRRLLYTHTDDITGQPFGEWLEIGNTFEDGGWLFPGDMYVDDGNRVHILWHEGPIHRGLRDRFFPDIKLRASYRYTQVVDGKIVLQRTLLEVGEDISDTTLAGAGGIRLQVTPTGRMVICYALTETDAGGRRVPRMRLMELSADGTTGEPVTVPMQYPMRQFFTATTRAGNAPSTTLDLLGVRAGDAHTISYARVRLW